MKNLIDLAYDIIDRNNNYKSNHLSFLVKRTTIITIGRNYEDKSHPIALRFGYIDGKIHSELDAIIKVTRHDQVLSRYSLYNVRIDRWSKIKISKPCVRCQRLLKSVGIKRIFYTLDHNQRFQQL